MTGLALSPENRQLATKRLIGSQAFVWIDTINQLLEYLGGQQIDHLILDPQWIEGTVWWPAILQALALTKISWSILLPLFNDVQVWDLSQAPHPMTPGPWPLCVVFDDNGLGQHGDQVLHFSPKMRELVEAIAGDPHHRVTLESINRVRHDRGEPPMSKGALRVYLHTLRRLVGSDHLASIRPGGYRWVNCHRSSRSTPDSPETTSSD